MSTDFFDVKCGLKQGCLLSSLLFSSYIDDHIRDMKLLNLGIEVEMIKCILTYADDVILVANTEEELHSFLNCLNSWSERTCLLKLTRTSRKLFILDGHQRLIFHVVT